MADLDDPSRLPWAEDLPPGTSLLVAGPPMTRKRTVLHRIVAAAGDDVARLFVTTRKNADAVAEEYRSVDPELPPELLAVVDCVGGQGEIGGDTDESRRYANDPGDLTGMGIHVSEYMRRFDQNPQVASVRLGLHTLSTMLMYANVRRVYQFLHVMIGRIDAAGFTGAFVMDEAPGSEQLNTLSQPFDGLVEVRDEDRWEHRVRGIDAGPREWTGL